MANRLITESFKMKKPRPPTAKTPNKGLSLPAKHKLTPKKQHGKLKCNGVQTHLLNETVEHDLDSTQACYSPDEKDDWVSSQYVQSDILWDNSSPKSRENLRTKTSGKSELRDLVKFLCSKVPAEAKPETSKSCFGKGLAQKVVAASSYKTQPKKHKNGTSKPLIETMEELLEIVQSGREQASGESAGGTKGTESPFIEISLEDDTTIRNNRDQQVLNSSEDELWEDCSDSFLIAASQIIEDVPTNPGENQKTPARNKSSSTAVQGHSPVFASPGNRRLSLKSPLGRNTSTVTVATPGTRKSPRLMSLSRSSVKTGSVAPHKTPPKIARSPVKKMQPFEMTVKNQMGKSKYLEVQNKESSAKAQRDDDSSDELFNDEEVLNKMFHSLNDEFTFDEVKEVPVGNSHSSSVSKFGKQEVILAKSNSLPSNFPLVGEMHSKVKNSFRAVAKSSDAPLLAKKSNTSFSSNKKSSTVSSRTTSAERKSQDSWIEISDDDDDVLLQPEVLSWLNEVDSQVCSSQPCTQEEIAKKREAALRKKQEKQRQKRQASDWAGRLRVAR